MIQQTKEMLMKKGVESSDLGINFRNSNEIFETSNNISRDQSQSETTIKVQQVLDVTKKGSTISSTQPTMYNFNWNTNGMKQEDLDKAANFSLQELKKRMNDAENDSYLVIFDEDRFHIKQIYCAIEKMEDKEDIKCYPSYKRDKPQTELDEFLQNPQGCLITTNKLIKGLECENGLVIQHGNSSSSNLRGNMMRVVSNLVLMNGIGECDVMQYNNVILNSELLYCINEGVIAMYECLSCKNQFNLQTKLCFACKKKCHDQTHNFAAWNVQNVKNKKCSCVLCTK